MTLPKWVGHFIRGSMAAILVVAASRQADYALTPTTDSYFTLFDRLGD